MSELKQFAEIMESMKAYIDHVEKEAYKRGLEEGEKHGADGAWDVAKRIALTKTDANCPYFTIVELEKIFGCSSPHSVFDIYSASEAIEKVKAYGEQQKADAEDSEIRVGDEIVAFSGKAIVFRRFTDDKGEDVCSYWYPDENRINRDRTSALKKTGRHFPQVEELLEAMKGES